MFCKKLKNVHFNQFWNDHFLILEWRLREFLGQKSKKKIGKNVDFRPKYSGSRQFIHFHGIMTVSLRFLCTSYFDLSIPSTFGHDFSALFAIIWRSNRCFPNWFFVRMPYIDVIELMKSNFIIQTSASGKSGDEFYSRIVNFHQIPGAWKCIFKVQRTSVTAYVHF